MKNFLLAFLVSVFLINAHCQDTSESPTDTTANMLPDASESASTNQVFNAITDSTADASGQFIADTSSPTALPSGVGANPSLCPQPFIYNPVLDKCYAVFNQTVDWIDADQFCKRLDANLLKINNQFLRTLAETFISCKGFLWVDTAERFNRVFSNPWCQGFPPRTAFASCLLFDQTCVRNAECLELHPFACEKDKFTPPPVFDSVISGSFGRALGVFGALLGK